MILKNKLNYWKHVKLFEILHVAKPGSEAGYDDWDLCRIIQITLSNILYIFLILTDEGKVG